jgi:hypothetical protein
MPGGHQPVDRLQDSFGGDLVDFLWDPLKKSLNATLHASIENSTGERVWGALWKPLEDSLEASLFFPLRDRLRDMLRAGDPRVLPPADGRSSKSLPAELGVLLLKSSGRHSALIGFYGGTARHLHWAFAGQHDAYWVAFYLFCEQALGVRYAPEQRRRLGLWADLCESGWWVPYDTWCICVDRPAAIEMERIPDPRRPERVTERFRSVEFRDGTKLQLQAP